MTFQKHTFYRSKGHLLPCKSIVFTLLLQKHYDTTPKPSGTPINKDLAFGVVFDQDYIKGNPFIHRPFQHFWCSVVVISFKPSKFTTAYLQLQYLYPYKTTAAATTRVATAVHIEF